MHSVTLTMIDRQTDLPSGLRVRLPDPIDYVFTPSGAPLHIGDLGPKDVERLAWRLAYQMIDHAKQKRTARVRDHD